MKTQENKTMEKPDANSMFYINGKGNTTWPEIVQAVNAHEELKNSLMDVLEFVSNNHGWKDEAVYQKALKALTKAGVKL